MKFTGRNKTKLVEEQVREWLIQTKKESRSEMMDTRPVITISRELGSDADQVAAIIRDTLGDPWKIWDEDILKEIEKKTSVRLDILKSMDERPFPKVQHFLEGLFLSKDFQDTYRKGLIDVIMHIAHFGHAIIIGRGVNFILPNSFRVRMVASRKKRAKVLENLKDTSHADALDLVRDFDQRHQEFVEQFFNSGINDPWNYDLCIKTSYISPQKAAELIISAAQEKLKL
jgi:cytidylate kinase